MIVLVSLLACKPGPATETGVPTPDDGVGLVGDHVLNPFPVGVFHMDGGRVALSADDFALETPTPLQVDRLAWRDGFSPAQTSVLQLEGLDPTGFPHWRDPTPGEGSVRLADLTEGTWLPVFAELDAHPDAAGDVLLVRPLVAVPVGHQVAVVVMDTAAPRVERFDALVSGTAPAGLAEHREHFAGLVGQLEALGVDPADIAIAWDYPVGDGTLPTRSVWSQAAIPSAHTFASVLDVPSGDPLPPTVWRKAEGTFTATDYLVDDRSLSLDADGGVTSIGTVEVDLYVHVPQSVADAPAGSVPVVLFGHGIFADPAFYLDSEDDGDGVQGLVDDAGFIAVATVWRGLTTGDRLGAIEAAQDFARIHEVTDRLVQGQSNVAELLRYMAEGDLFADPVFRGASDQPLVDRGALRYYGISLGGIEGAVMLANDPPLDAAVLHVGGSTWSTMLERSSNWSGFEIFLDLSVPDLVLRQRLYATSQLWWDAVDPVAYTADLAQRDFLLQEAIGDEQVPNMTTRILARSSGLPLLQPPVEAVWGLDPVNAPQPPGSRAYVQLDPERALPPDVNRPAEITGAHTAPRVWSTTQEQIRAYLELGAERRIVHPCGAEPCRESNVP